MELNCLRCKGKMEQGFVTGVRGVPLNWIEEMGTGALGLVMKPKGERPITTYRCTECGLLESYAAHTAKEELDSFFEHRV